MTGRVKGGGGLRLAWKLIGTSGMSSGRGRGRREFVDRKQVLVEARSRPNVMEGVVAVECDRAGLRSAERKYSHKLIVPAAATAAATAKAGAAESERPVLQAYVLVNDICVLVLPEGALQAQPKEASFDPSLEASVEVSGKKKHGAKVVKAGSVVFSTIDQDGKMTHFRTPVGGQWLETNRAVTTDLNLLWRESAKLGYLGVLLPNTPIPTLSEAPSYAALVEMLDRKRNDRVCHAWLKGSCTRENCKFLHSQSSASSSSSSLSAAQRLSVDDTEKEGNTGGGHKEEAAVEEEEVEDENEVEAERGDKAEEAGGDSKEKSKLEETDDSDDRAAKKSKPDA